MRELERSLICRKKKFLRNNTILSSNLLAVPSLKIRGDDETLYF